MDYDNVPQPAASENEWTIMIFFAGDKQLSPSMTSQLKAIKDAGFQENTTVLIHFDANERGAGPATFEVNRVRKEEKSTIIGDGKNPFVRNLKEDFLAAIPKSETAVNALRKFLALGLRDYAAKHYMIFLVGHGMIVGNDAFLPDEQPESAITLKELGDTLSHFSGAAQLSDGIVELVGLHSCSMSAVEVAYQLKGSARYLMATEGVSFVSSWPYRQLLKKILGVIDEAKTTGEEVDVDDLIHSIQRLSLHNSTDFMFSGLSADLSLCRLDPDIVDGLTGPLKRLTKALRYGLKDSRGLELILLAHLKSQSFWNENYTDLYDFCLCLERECKAGDTVQDHMIAACKAVRAELEESPDGKSLIVESDFFGPLYQFSHGLSVYFPWARPLEENGIPKEDEILARYKNYAFTEALGSDSWLSFLQEYFAVTQRQSREVEDGVEPAAARNGEGKVAVNTMFAVAGAAGGGVDSLDDDTQPRKPNPTLDDRKPSPPMGQDFCGCSVKNYPMHFSQSVRAAQDANPGAGDVDEQRKSSKLRKMQARVRV